MTRMSSLTEKNKPCQFVTLRHSARKGVGEKQPLGRPPSPTWRNQLISLRVCVYIDLQLQVSNHMVDHIAT